MHRVRQARESRSRAHRPGRWRQDRSVERTALVPEHPGDGRIGVELRCCIGLRGGEGGTGFAVLLASSALGARLVPARLALGAIFVPVIALAPAARRPFAAPGFIWFRPRPFWINSFLTARVPSHSEGMCGAG
eukprot:6048996-Pleurochrysis_carterae.AAC.1